MIFILIEKFKVIVMVFVVIFVYEVYNFGYVLYYCDEVVLNKDCNIVLVKYKVLDLVCNYI